MKKIMVIGAGFMGTGIAQVCIQSGYDVVLSDVEPKALEKAKKAVDWSLAKLESKGRLAEPLDTISNRLELVEGIVADDTVDLVMEAVFEDVDLKKQLLEKLEPQVRKDTIIGTNTSSIPVSKLASFLEKPERFVGLHFFGPVPLMGLVEVVKGDLTKDSVFELGMDFIRKLGKHPVGVKKDVPGFVMNRVFAAAFKECQDLMDKGIATPEDVDAGMRLGYGWNIGPFEIVDNAGLDTVLRINKSMKAMGETCLYSDATILEEYVADGKLGRKANEGFYRYDPETGKKLK